MAWDRSRNYAPTVNNFQPSSTAVVLLGLFLLLFVLFIFYGNYMANADAYGVCIIAEILFAAVCKYRQIFFVILMTTFLWAGSGVPFASGFLEVRWFVLGCGAVAGMAMYM